jgi:lipopolysaccharide transport system ATP-binding protein
LKDVSFNINRGEVVGIIGRNGAGKSTLLKILSRITEPTDGHAEIRGRVGSLLEVGTGFHPELSGRENIYLNGTILGMKKTEIQRKFDEIVAFAEVEKFIDTPVKHYSSGMYVRLAFAVAAHLEPEVLLIDEVLAVGDIAFQKKCLGKMGEVAKSGRTVIFVSHQMNQMRRLCERVAWLDSGGLRKIGSGSEVISGYEAAMSSISVDASRTIDDGHVAARFLKWEISEPRDAQANLLKATGPVSVKFIVKVIKGIKNGCHGIALFNNDNQLIWATVANHLQLEPGICTFLHDLPALPVRPGVYYWQVSLYDDNGLIDLWFGLPEMVVATESMGHPLDKWQGVLNIPWNFSVRQEKQ